MRAIISLVIIILAAVPGFFMDTGINEAMGGATLFAIIAGFACTIHAIERKKIKTIFRLFQEVHSMKDMIGYCGLDCEKCDAYLATLHDDHALREKTAKLWAELNHAPILPEHINCDGCRVDGRKTVYCDSLCGIRQCALQKGVKTCGSCPELDACQKVGMVIANDPTTLENLKG